MAETFYAKATVRSLIGSRGFDPEGRIEDLGGTLQDHQLRLEVSYPLGLRWRFEASSIPVGITSWAPDAGASSVDAYAGGGELALAYRVLGGAWPLTVRAGAGARPSSGIERVIPSSSGPVPVVEPIVGMAFGRLGLKLETGWSWGWLTLAGGGQVFSVDALEPALEAFLQVGFVPHPDWRLDLHSSGWMASGDLSSTSPDRAATYNVLGAGQTRYVGIGLGIEWWFVPGVAFTVGLDGAPIARANLATPSLSVGMAFRGPAGAAP